ncbi:MULTISPECIES: isocitrate lyase/phosphoenolpyruvate mutase family protein [unclassified Streptomyces]|uniref:isocitrate lyase/phosphoenolpyruvate mutase family protein n=1 Tax=unclassified Streptomyces TaxID=2593676 RepID=UPI0003C9794B|nr:MULTISPECIES: isocitrate lyase/phosphoenolpyruvate mutase family protein [unclassified Streptomyces]AGZ94431.1 PEP mutase [Streptomyces sp. NRRL B-16215]
MAVDREFLTEKLWIGVYDALTARLVGEGARACEFGSIGGLWVSSYCVSATMRACPDASIVSSAEMVAIGRRIDLAARGLPVVLDCDSGYGDDIVLRHVVEEVCRTSGIAGICVEDKVFPKRNSFYSAQEQRLEEISVFADKIRAADAARRATRPDLAVIARTEALVAGQGVPAALERMRAFTEAGADALMVQGTGPLEDLFEVARRWKSESSVPLIGAPTLYPDQSPRAFWKEGFDVYIYANQLMRAVGPVMDRLVREAADTERGPSSLGQELWSLRDVDRLVGVGHGLADRAVPAETLASSSGPEV